jgi:uncharacterized protein YaiI (UPF0178 family)
MKIWVDADACPKVIKEILFRVADRRSVEVILVANQLLPIPKSQFVRCMTVPSGIDAADHAIAAACASGDLVITADIPLAAAVVEKMVLALNPRGELYTADNIRQALSLRNFMDELRGSGVQTGGPPPFHQRDRQAFAHQLDTLLTRLLRAR